MGISRADVWSRRGQALVVLLALGALTAIYLWVGDDHSDIGVYHDYAIAFFTPAGAVRHLPVEYPPLALLPFSLTLIPLGIDFGAVFVGAMAAFFVASWAVIARSAFQSATTAYVVYMLIAGPWTLLGRYDLVPSLVVLVAIVVVDRGRWRIAYALLAVGVLLKLYPLFLVPLFALEQWRRSGRVRFGPGELARLAVGPGVFGLIVLAGIGAAAIVEPGGWLSPIRYAFGRPVQSESLGATALWLLSGFGSPGTLDHSYNSVNVIATGSGLVSAASLVALVTGCVAVYVRHAARRPTLRQSCLACLAVVVLTSKVLSPQYLVWLLPLVALEVGLDPIWIGVCVLTFIAYPIVFAVSDMNGPQQMTTFPIAFLVAVAARNVLLLIATWRAVRGPTRARVVAAA